MEIKEMLKKLCLAAGVSGNEYEACNAAAEILKEYTDDVSVDNFGCVSAFIGDRNNGRPTVMLEAHIDEIGFIVTYIDDKGFLKVAGCGGTDRRLYAAQTVTIHTEGGNITGVVSTLPPHVASDSDKAMKTDEISIDVGMNAEQAKQKIAPGDRVTIDVPFTEMLGSRVSCKAIDDRSGAAAILYALELAKGKTLRYNIEVLFASQEEVGSRGAIIGAFRSQAQYAIATDVSFAYTPDAKKEQCGVMGKGAMIGISPSLDRKLTAELRKLADDNKIPYQLEIMSDGTGTDADDISISHGGIITALISIPEKYMHTPVEVVDTEDIKSVSRIMAAFVTGGEADV